jgi:cytochrome c peroxidase
MIRLAIALVIALSASGALAQEDPAEVTIGERLFLETRFAEFFAQNQIDANTPLPAGDPVVESTETTNGSLPGPFAGESMNCRSCHLVDEHLDSPGGGMRTYADFARRSPIPARHDGKLVAPRNSPSLVNASLPRPNGLILHFDGEFPSIEALVRGTLTGRNYGWLPNEGPLAVAHIARVIREDDGSGALASDFGGAYRTVLLGVDPSLPPELVLPAEFRIDVDRASDEEIVDAVARLIAAYVEQLVFATDAEGEFAGSPYDAFLAANALPNAPAPGESAAAYTRRLRAALDRLTNPAFVSDGPFEFHAADRVFGPQELQGLRIFLRPAPARRLNAKEIAAGGIGNCASCHVAPNFTDFGFHNTGVAQFEYDGLHGAGTFASLPVPTLAERNAHPNRWLPATAAHPNAQEPYRSVPAPDAPGLTDLGLWNIYANHDFRGAIQGKLWRTLCDQQLALAGVTARTPAHQIRSITRRRCTPNALLAASVAQFKTPGLRDLPHSAPYMHNGQQDTLEDVVALYRRAASDARAGRLRNAAPELRGIALLPADVDALAAFMRSLNEDYN